VNVVTGGPSAGAELAAHPGVAKVTFTGGSATGRAVAQMAATHLAPTTLELGGKSPHIVFPDADLGLAVDGIVRGIFSSAGQTCIAGSRAFLHAAVYDEVLERLRDRAEGLRIGNPLDEATELGPLCFEGHRKRVEKIVDEGVAEGATVVTGAQRPTPARPGWFYKPTILSDVTSQMRVARDEIFGPVLSVLRWEDERSMLADVTASPYGLAAGIWTKDLAHAYRLSDELDVGTVWINTYRSNDPAVPFGGVRESGYGVENGAAALQEYTRLKVTWTSIATAEGGS
jgi:aldehyde dehydrogenase (NAD+)